MKNDLCSQEDKVGVQRVVDMSNLGNRTAMEGRVRGGGIGRAHVMKRMGRSRRGIYRVSNRCADVVEPEDNQVAKAGRAELSISGGEVQDY